MVEKVNLAQKLSLFDDVSKPKIVPQMNDLEIPVVKVKGEFDWHRHEKTDKLFLVLKGGFCVCLRTGDVWLNEALERIQSPTEARSGTSRS